MKEIAALSFAIPAIDGADAAGLSQGLLGWLRDTAPPTSDLTTLVQYYHASLPRTLFLKSLPPAAHVLDLGAGDGALGLYKAWPEVERPDLHLHALSLTRGPHFHLYDSVELRDFETADDLFGGRQFDAIICCHFIEHMHDIGQTMAFIGRVLAPHGRIYIEWPHPVAMDMPPRSLVQHQGWDLSTLNFHDDQTHVRIWDIGDVAARLRSLGMGVETIGRVYAPWLADEMKCHALTTSDSTLLTLAVWLKFAWAQYLIASR